MHSVKRKREVSSCIPCHTRKQKCDRQYPCNRCSRRRRPELCAYYSFQPQAPGLPPHGLVTPPEKNRDEDLIHVAADGWEQDNIHEDELEEESSATPGTPRQRNGSTSLAEAFGYDGRSECNTMALVRKLVPEDDGADTKDAAIPSETATEVRKALDQMPNRRIIDFLVRYFVTEVNWIEQLLYPPWFLSQYQRWWGLYSVSTVSDIEFVILILRVCCYASQFLPSPSYTIDSVKGVPLVEIRRSCEQVIQLLNPICIRLDPRGSLVRVQHIAYGGLAAGSVGRMNGFWESVSCASRVAQHIGLHLDSVISASSTDELDKEMRRRTFCNLYIWDSYLSRHLDRIPFLSDTLNADILPRMRLVSDAVDLQSSDAPNVFTERILRARLAQFWRTNRPPRGPEWDVIAAEERYEEFCSTFLQALPPAFALEPDKQWDERLPSLPMQRQLLHIAIFELLCWNFRPTLMQQPDEIGRLPLYKQIMMAHAKRALAAAALSLLQSVSNLHKLMGGSHTRFSGIILPMFEAAVPLLCLCSDQSFPGDPIPEGRWNGRNSNPLCIRIGKVTREECMQATRDASSSLETLSEVSEVAEVGARTLARLISRVDSLPPQMHQACGATMGDMNFDPMAECISGGGQGMFPFGNGAVSPGWADLLGDMTDTFGIQVEDMDFTKRGHPAAISH